MSYWTEIQISTVQKCTLTRDGDEAVPGKDRLSVITASPGTGSQIQEVTEEGGEVALQPGGTQHSHLV